MTDPTASPPPKYEPEIRERAAAVAANFQKMMQQPDGRRPGQTLLLVLFVLFVSWLPIGTTLAINITVCNTPGGTVISNARPLCPISTPADPTVTIRSTQTRQDMQETLTALRALTPTTAADMKLRLDLITELEAKLSLRPTDTTAQDTLTQHQQDRGAILFLTMSVAYTLWMIIALLAQITVVNRTWYGLARIHHAPTDHRKIRWQLPGVATLLIGLFTFLLLIALQRLNDAAPGVAFLSISSYWALIAASCSALIAITAIGVLAFASNYPDPIRAHQIKRALQSLSRKFPKPNTPKNTELLKLGLDASAKDRPAKRASLDQKDYPRVSHSMSAGSALNAVKSLCMLLGVTMIVTIIYVELGFDMRDNTAAEAPNAALIASSNAWTLSLGMGMSLSLLVIYLSGMSRLLPYTAAATKSGPDLPPAWHVTANSKDTKNLNELTYVATPIKATSKDPDPILKRKDRLALGANDTKVDTILKGASNGGGLHGALEADETKLVKFAAQILGILAPALASGALAFLT